MRRGTFYLPVKCRTRHDEDGKQKGSCPPDVRATAAQGPRDGRWGRGACSGTRGDRPGRAGRGAALTRPRGSDHPTALYSVISMFQSTRDPGLPSSGSWRPGCSAQPRVRSRGEHSGACSSWCRQAPFPASSALRRAVPTYEPSASDLSLARRHGAGEPSHIPHAQRDARAGPPRRHTSGRSVWPRVLVPSVPSSALADQQLL